MVHSWSRSASGSAKAWLKIWSLSIGKLASPPAVGDLKHRAHAERAF
jgi:hypothetical protein